MPKDPAHRPPIPPPPPPLSRKAGPPSVRARTSRETETLANGVLHEPGVVEAAQRLTPEYVERAAPAPRAVPRPGVELTEPPPPLMVLESRIRELIRLQGRHPDSELIEEVLLNGLKLIRDGSSRMELRILAAALREMRYANKVFRPYAAIRKVTIFGSARTPREAPEYRQARDFAAEMVRRGYMVITGAGGGIMEAAQAGASRAHSFGLNIRLPFEQAANQVIAGDRKLIYFRYFFTRKLSFVKEASAVALFPGGMGTLDEGFETLTLIQTGKAALIPLVMIDRPGGKYWRDWAGFIRRQLGKRGLISPGDLNLFKLTDDLQEAADEITNFYRRYHSSRFVKDLLVIRLSAPLPPGRLEELNERFLGLMNNSGARVRETPPLPEEADQPELQDLPRLCLPFNRRDYGSLRKLIDAVNRE